MHLDKQKRAFSIQLSSGCPACSITSIFSWAVTAASSQMDMHTHGRATIVGQKWKSCRLCTLPLHRLKCVGALRAVRSYLVDYELLGDSRLFRKERRAERHELSAFGGENFAVETVRVTQVDKQSTSDAYKKKVAAPTRG